MGGNPQPGPGQAPAVSASIEVNLHGATEGARVEFKKALQDYAERLANESQTQEISNRPPGVMYPEVTANSVVRAKTSLGRYGERAKPSRREVVALVGLPIFSGGTGILGSYLNSPLQWATFSVTAFLAVVCVFYLAARRML
jgi:hypothetical protein